MSNLQARIKAIEKSPSVQSAARIEHAKATGDYSQLSDAELDAVSENARRDIEAHPLEWAARCESLAGRIGEDAAAALAELRLNDIDTPTLKNILVEVENAKLAQAA